MAKGDETLEALPDFAGKTRLPQKTKASQLLMEGHQLRKVVEEAKERLDEIKAQLAEIQILNDLPGMRYNGLCFIAIQRDGKRMLNRELLIDNGVDPGIIEASMKKGQPYVEKELAVIGEAAAKREAKKNAAY